MDDSFRERNQDFSTIALTAFYSSGHFYSVLLCSDDIPTPLLPHPYAPLLPVHPQLAMMSGIFPRHIIEHFSSEAQAVPEHMGQLARTHEGVTILFMDIVGKPCMSHHDFGRSISIVTCRVESMNLG